MSSASPHPSVRGRGSPPPWRSEGHTHWSSPQSQAQFTALAPNLDRRADLQVPPPYPHHPHPTHHPHTHTLPRGRSRDWEDCTQVAPSTPPPNGKDSDKVAEQVTSSTPPFYERGGDRKSDHQTYFPARDAEPDLTYDRLSARSSMT